MLQFMRLQRVRHNLVTKQQQPGWGPSFLQNSEICIRLFCASLEEKLEFCFITELWFLIAFPLFPHSFFLLRSLIARPVQGWVLCPSLDHKMTSTKVWVPQSFQLCDPMDCTVHGILHARILEWVAISFSRGASWPKVWTWVSYTTGRLFTVWATREDLDQKWLLLCQESHACFSFSGDSQPYLWTASAGVGGSFLRLTP